MHLANWLSPSPTGVHTVQVRLKVISNLLISSYAPLKMSHTHYVRAQNDSLQVGTVIIIYYCVLVSL